VSEFPRLGSGRPRAHAGAGTYLQQAASVIPSPQRLVLLRRLRFLLFRRFLVLWASRQTNLGRIRQVRSPIPPFFFPQHELTDFQLPWTAQEHQKSTPFMKSCTQCSECPFQNRLDNSSNSAHALSLVCPRRTLGYRSRLSPGASDLHQKWPLLACTPPHSLAVAISPPLGMLQPMITSPFLFEIFFIPLCYLSSFFLFHLPISLTIALLSLLLVHLIYIILSPYDSTILYHV
jgi:hypothetical protein